MNYQLLPLLGDLFAHLLVAVFLQRSNESDEVSAVCSEYLILMPKAGVVQQESVRDKSIYWSIDMYLSPMMFLSTQVLMLCELKTTK